MSESKFTPEQIKETEALVDLYLKLFRNKFLEFEGNAKTNPRHAEFDMIAFLKLRSDQVLYWIDQAPLYGIDEEPNHEQRSVLQICRSMIKKVVNGMGSATELAVKFVAIKKIMYKMRNDINTHTELKKQNPNIITDEITNTFKHLQASTICRAEYLLDTKFELVE
jgi:hypothetical protein